MLAQYWRKYEYSACTSSVMFLVFQMTKCDDVGSTGQGLSDLLCTSFLCPEQTLAVSEMIDYDDHRTLELSSKAVSTQHLHFM